MKNPLKQLNESGITYKTMAHITELHVNTIANIANMTDFEVMKKVTLETAYILHNKLGIDILKFIKY